MPLNQVKPNQIIYIQYVFVNGIWYQITRNDEYAIKYNQI